MTNDQIKTCPDADLPKMAAEVLQPDREQCKCDTFHRVKAWDEFRCNDCAGYEDENTIPLTWPNAMKWRDWAVEKVGDEAFREAFLESLPEGFNVFFHICHAQPQHYIKAAMLCAAEGE